MQQITTNTPAKNQCRTCLVRAQAICADLSDDEMDLLHAIGHRTWLEPGEPLIWEGDEAALVANVIEGVVKLSAQGEDGKEQILGLGYPSDFLGRPFGSAMPYGVEALTKVQVCVFRREDFEAFTRSHPRLEHKLLERTLCELDRTRRWLLMLGRMSAEQKLASLLLEISERRGPRICPAISDSKQAEMADGAISLPLSRAQIADVLGLTVETVSRLFTKMKNEGLIAVSGRRDVTILNGAELANRASPMRA